VEDIKENTSPPSPSAPASPPPLPSKKISRIQHPLLAGLSFITFVLLLVFAFITWQWHQQTSAQSSQVSQRLNQLQQHQTVARSNTQAIDQLTQANQKLMAQLNTLSQNMSHHAQQLAQLSGGNRNDWLLSEAEYLLRLANQRLNLEHDIAGAELILKAADGVLKEIDDPALLPARVAVAEELLSLQSLANTDLQGAQARLRALMKMIPSLPERHQSKAGKSAIESDSPVPDSAQTMVSNAQSLWDQILDELKKAVVIQRLDQSVTPLLPPEQKYYLRHNLRLMYEQSALALVERDDESYQGSLNQAEAWLNDYFSTSDPQVKAQLDTVLDLKNIQLALALPDISQSLRLVKARIEAMYRDHQLPKHTSKIETIEAMQQ
jgi:uroporphyrin-3 C-methyltransferase